MDLVTGATGLVGSHLVVELLKRGIKVRAARRKSSDTSQVYKLLEYYSVKKEAFSDLLEWIEVDLRNPFDAYTAVEDISRVYHAAAKVSFDPRERKDVIKSNIEITSNIVNACLDQNHIKLCYVSSTSALGSADAREEVNEESPWIEDKTRSAYSLGKYKSELEVWRGISEGLDAVIVNPSIIIGPGDWNYSSLRIFKAVWDGMNYYTEGITGYVDVSDVVKSMIWLAESDISGEKYVISSENLSYREVLSMIAKELSKKVPSRHASPLLLGTLWRLDWLKSIIKGGKRNFTRETARAAQQNKYFSSRKIADTMGIRFIPVKKSIDEAICFFYATRD